MKLLLLNTILLMVSVTFAQGSREITWPDLKAEVTFDDPFGKLTRQQLHNLSYVAKIREWDASSSITVSSEEIARKDSLEQVLRAEKVNFEGLLAIRHEIAALREKRAESVNDALSGSKVRIAGYVLPLNFSNGNVTEFLLAPWIGACIHTPPPPKNQLIYVSTSEGFEYADRFQAVRVEGEMHTEEKTSNLFLVDGFSEVPSGYRILDARVSIYNNGPSGNNLDN